MYGISSSSKERIANLVEEMFDSIALDFLGNIPKLRNKKFLAISGQSNMGLPHLFVQAMQNKSPNIIEQDVLKSLLDSSFGYIDSLKSKVQSNITEQIDGLAREARISGSSVSNEDLHNILNEEFTKAKTHLKMITETESTKYRNLGTAMEITRVSSGLGDSDPTVFFVTSKDDSVCVECRRLHLMKDGVTPRVWKLSELKGTFGKRGDEVPSMYHQHPNDRCSLTYLPSGFGFNSAGLVTYISPGFDALSNQRK